MKGYVIYNKEIGKYVDKSNINYLTDWAGNAAIYNNCTSAEEMAKRLNESGLSNYEVRCLTDEDSKGEGLSHDLMSVGELPGLAADLKRWETSILMCGIMGIMDGNLGANEGKRIKEEAEKVEAVRSFIEHGLAKGL